MPARTGQEYITGLKDRPREVWIDGECVEDVTTHPALRNGVRSVAALYDMHAQPAAHHIERNAADHQPVPGGAMPQAVNASQPFASTR